MRFVLASGNAHKLAEFRAILAPHAVEPPPAGIELPLEGTESFTTNTQTKTRALATHLRTQNNDVFAIADDSGLEVEALGGAPGVISSRYAGREGDDAANNARLLVELAGLLRHDRRARFVCVLVCVPPDGDEIEVRGEWAGAIARARRGTSGFGYDPLFVPDGGERTVAELAEAEKNRQSHRARAGQALLERLAARAHEAPR